MQTDFILLSESIDSIPTRTERILESSGAASQSWPQRANDWVSDRQTLKGGFVVLILSCLIPLSICWGALIFRAKDSDASNIQKLEKNDIEHSSSQSSKSIEASWKSHIETVTQVTAGIAGILLAVVVFSVQLHAQRQDEGAFMTRYLVKKQKVPWITGYALGLATFNVIVLLLHVLGVSWSWPIVASIDIIAALLLVCATFWLIFQSVHDATDSTFDLGFKLFQRDLSKIIAEDSYFNELLAKYGEVLKDTVLGQDYWAIYSSSLKRDIRLRNQTEKPIEFYVSESGIVSDINVPCLKGLNELLVPISRRTTNFSSQLFLSPGDKVESHPALILSAGVHDIDEQSNGLNEQIDDVLKGDIQNLLDRTFEIKKNDESGRREFENFFERYAVRLQRMAKSGNAILLSQLLEKYQQIIELTATEHERARTSTARALTLKPRLTNPLESSFYDIARLCFASDDQQAVEALLDSSKAIYAIGWKRTASAICYWSLEVLSFIYFLGTKTTSGAMPLDVLRDQYDRLLHYIYFPFESRRLDLTRHTPQEIKSIFDKEQNRLDAVIAFNLEVVRRAIDVGAYDHCGQFVDRLFEFREHRYHGQERYGQAPVEESVETLHDYALILLVGWCLYLVAHSQASEESRRSLGTFILEMIQYAPCLEEIVAIWELYHPQHISKNIDQRLRVDFLDSESETRRVGKTYGGFRNSDWQRRGALALMLLIETLPEFNSSSFFVSAPDEFTWDLAADESTLRELVLLPELNIPEADRETRVTRVLSLLRKRKHFAEKSVLLEIADTVVDHERIVEFKQDATESWKKHRGFVPFIQEKLGRNQAIILPLKAAARWKIPISSLQSKNSWARGFGSFLGEDLAKSEAIRLLYTAEQNSLEYAKCHRLRELSTQISDAKLSLESKEYVPNIVVIPESDRFNFALFRQPSWTLRSSSKNEFPMWEGLYVLNWPYVDPSSILIADISNFFGSNDPEASIPEFKIEEPSLDERRQFRETIINAQDLGELPDSNKLQATTSATLVPMMGIVDPNAALRINLDKCNGMYAILNGAYHRPWCSEIVGKENIEYALFPERASNAPTPCQICHPDAWDLEAMRGDDRCLGPA